MSNSLEHVNKISDTIWDEKGITLGGPIWISPIKPEGLDEENVKIARIAYYEKWRAGTLGAEAPDVSVEPHPYW